jgi:hypothetical protein
MTISLDDPATKFEYKYQNSVNAELLSKAIGYLDTTYNSIINDGLFFTDQKAIRAFYFISTCAVYENGLLQPHLVESTCYDLLLANIVTYLLVTIRNNLDLSLLPKVDLPNATTTTATTTADPAETLVTCFSFTLLSVKTVLLQIPTFENNRAYLPVLKAHLDMLDDDSFINRYGHAQALCAQL